MLDIAYNEFASPTFAPSRSFGRGLWLASLMLLIPAMFFMIAYNASAYGLRLSLSGDSPSLTETLSDAIKQQYVVTLRNRLAQNPMKLRKFSRRQILSVLDRPDLQRAEGDYRHWQYVSERCVIDIYMKDRDHMGQKPSRPVQFVDFQPRRKAGMYGAQDDPGPVNKKACLTSMIAQD